MSDVEKWIEQWRDDLANAEALNSPDIHELESHLREEIEHLKTAGLSDEEAFLLARRRLGDAPALEEEFTKVSPHRRFAHRLSWMVIGVLVYFLLRDLSTLATYGSTLVWHAVGLRSAHVTILGCVAHAATFIGIGSVSLHQASRWRSPVARPNAPTPIRLGLFVACALAATQMIEFLFGLVLVRTMRIEDYVQVAQVRTWASLGWSTLMLILVAGLLGVLVLRERLRPTREAT